MSKYIAMEIVQHQPVEGIKYRTFPLSGIKHATSEAAEIELHEAMRTRRTPIRHFSYTVGVVDD
jgi:hypothetical protein